MTPKEQLPEPAFHCILFSPVPEDGGLDPNLPWLWSLWRRYFCDKRFGHVLVASYMADLHTWTVVDNNYGGTSVYSVSGDLPLIDIMQSLKCTNVVIVKRKAQAHQYRHRGILTCVSLVKSILGVSKFWCVTPRQLWYYLQDERELELLKRKDPDDVT